MKDIPTSPRIALIKRNQKVKRLRLLILFTILFISIIGATSYFSSYPKIVIQNINILGNNIIEEKDISNKVESILSGKYLKLYSRSNFIIYPHNQIINNLKIDFPRIENISIKRIGFNTLNITITERVGSYLYCGLTVPEKKEDIGENCYFINNDGYIFDKAPYFSGDIYFKYYTNIDGNILKPSGGQMYTKERFHELVRFIDGVSSLGFKPSYLVTSQDEQNSLFLRSTGVNSNPKIIFKDTNDLVTILDNFKTAMSKKEFSNEINSKYDNLLYVDLRFKNKVLYKFQ